MNIEIKDKTLTIQGETKVPEIGSGQYLLDEISYDKFVRTLNIITPR